MVRPPILDDVALTDLATKGGYSNVVSMSEYTSVLCLSLLAVASQRFYWETQTQPITDSQWQTIKDKIEIGERELMSNISIGTIFWSISLMVDPSLLIPLGQSVPQADYPELSLVVPAAWLSGSDIVLPNMIETGIIAGMDIPSLGLIRGSNTHQLTQSEMPAHTHIQDPHSHSYQLTTAIPTAAGLEPTFADLTTQAPSLTGNSVAVNQNAGGDAPHNNVQRSLQLVPYLVAR